MVSEKKSVQLRDRNIQSETEIKMVDSSDDDLDEKNSRQSRKEDIRTS